MLVCKGKQNVKVDENSMYDLGTKMNHENTLYIDSTIYNTNNTPPKPNISEKLDNRIFTVGL